jgi:HTH-type transcriptional regulator/antitoxin HigA
VPRTKNVRVRSGQDTYVELIMKFPLRPLRTDEELDRAIEIIDSLIIRGDLEPGEQDYLDILTDASMLRHLIDARQLTQSKLATDVKMPMSTVSEVLNGKRRLNRKHIALLSKYFGVSPAVFQP